MTLDWPVPGIRPMSEQALKRTTLSGCGAVNKAFRGTCRQFSHPMLSRIKAEGGKGEPQRVAGCGGLNIKMPLNNATPRRLVWCHTPVTCQLEA